MVTYISFWARVIIASRIILYRKLSLQVPDLPCGRSLHSPPRHRRRRRRSASPRLSASRPPRRWVPLAWDSGRLRRPWACLHSRSIAAAAGGRHGEPLSNKTSTIWRRRRRWCFNSAMQSCNIAMHDTTIKRLYSGVLRFVCCLTVYSKWASVDVRGYHETSTDQRVIVPNAYYDTRETIRDAILTYNQKLACLIYRTEPTINKWKTEKLKTKKRVCSEVSVNSPENPYSHSGRRKGRLWCRSSCCYVVVQLGKFRQYTVVVSGWLQGILYKKSSKPLSKEWKKKYVTLLEDGRLTYHPSLHVRCLGRCNVW